MYLKICVSLLSMSCLSKSRKTQEICHVILKGDLTPWVCIPRFLQMKPGVYTACFIYSCEHGECC